MKSKLLSIGMAVIMCLGLSVPVMAAPSIEEGLKPVSVTYNIGTGNMEQTLVEKPVSCYLFNYETGEEGMGTLHDYALIENDTVFTVKHTGEQNDGSYISIFVKELVQNENGEYMLAGDYPQRDYLANDGSFLAEWLDPTDHGGEVKLYAGESVKFTLSTDETSDVIYHAQYIINYPEYDCHYTRNQFYRVDEAGVAECLANLEETEVPVTEETPAEPEEPVKEEISETPVTVSFTDVPTDKFYAKPIAWAVENNITSGTSKTTFSPDQTCTNAQILTFLWKAMGSPEATIENPFTDVDESKYYYKAALWAYENGVVYDTVLNANEPCTRAMTVTYQWRAAKQPMVDPAEFADVKVDTTKQDAWAIGWAVEEGITSGTSDTTFSPDKVCTRGEIMTFLYRDLAK